MGNSKRMSLDNGTFDPIQLCHTLSVLLYHFPSNLLNFSKKRKEDLFAVLNRTASAYHVKSKYVENYIFSHN